MHSQTLGHIQPGSDRAEDGELAGGDGAGIVGGVDEELRGVGKSEGASLISRRVHLSLNRVAWPTILAACAALHEIQIRGLVRDRAGLAWALDSVKVQP